MSAKRRTGRDRRRRSLGQNFLVDTRAVDRVVEGSGVGPADLVLDVGAGRGALTLPLARRGVEVWAIEPDRHWADELTRAVAAERDLDVRIIRTDVRRLRPPDRPYRVVANPPFGLTTDLLRFLLDEPERGPTRADLVVQREVARKHAASPPRSLRTAAWAPWWTFAVGQTIHRSAFRPVPSVDAAVLTIVRRPDPVLPERLATDLADILRPHWDPNTRR